MKLSIKTNFSFSKLASELPKIKHTYINFVMSCRVTEILLTVLLKPHFRKNHRKSMIFWDMTRNL